MVLEVAERLKFAADNPFARIQAKEREKRRQGVEIISLAIGNPDLPTPEPIIEKLIAASRNPENSGYPPFIGKPELRQAIAEWNEKRFGTRFDPESEILPLVGSAEGPTIFALTFINPGDLVLVPDPTFPYYNAAVSFAGGEVYSVPLLEENDFLPDFETIPEEVARRAKALFLNYPNNPTGAVAGLDFLRRAVEFAREYEIILCYDNPYSEITFDGFVAPSIFQVEGAKEISLEFNSLSKSYNMAGWRIGYVLGRAELIAGMRETFSYVDTRTPTAVQEGAAELLRDSQEEKWRKQIAQIYGRRSDSFVKALREAGWPATKRKGTFYLWEPVPEGFSAEGFADFLLEEVAVVVMPGTAFGPGGEGFIRLSLVLPEEKLLEAARRMGRVWNC
ncbi:MAG: aminotransferase class I/II-fold pyridoxal phosphate-dependent enzyme [Anaerolineae bacterium]